MGAACSASVAYLLRWVDSTVWSTICWYQAFSWSVWAAGPRALRRSGASVPPGAAATTRMPLPAYSKASDAVRALTPPLVAADK